MVWYVKNACVSMYCMGPKAFTCIVLVLHMNGGKIIKRVNEWKRLRIINFTIFVRLFIYHWPGLLLRHCYNWE